MSSETAIYIQHPDYLSTKVSETRDAAGRRVVILEIDRSDACSPERETRPDGKGGFDDADASKFYCDDLGNDVLVPDVERIADSDIDR